MTPLSTLHILMKKVSTNHLKVYNYGKKSRGSQMKLRAFTAFLFLGVFLSLHMPALSSAADRSGKGVREPVCADDRWYPRSAPVLSELVKGYLSKAEVEPVSGELIGLIVPHAAYTFSGQVAADAYKHLQKASYQRVVIIGPSHYVEFKGISVDLQSGYRTPLGTVPVDQTFAQELLSAGKQIQYVPQAFTREHSLEMQLPFLQTVLADFRIVPVVMGEYDYGTCTFLAESLANVIKKSEGKTLIISSTDLSHFYSVEKAKALDQKFMEHVRAFDPKGLYRSMAAGECEACGGGPTVATMLCSKELGANRAVIFHYANSGDVNGNYRQVVGYLSAALLSLAP
jgi:AmmeMemoRadiSam system protein B